MFFKKRSINKILIVGSPKSGTTALFYKILKSSPDPLLSFFEPIELAPIPKNNKSSLTKIVILEKPKIEQIKKFSHVILIKRDPRDILISSMLYEAGYHNLWDKDDNTIDSAIKILKRKEENPKSISVKELWNKITYPSLTIDNFIERISHLQSFDSVQGLFTITYDNIIGHEFNKLSDFLGFDIKGEVEVDNEHGRVIRTKSSGNWRKWFTDEDVSFFKSTTLNKGNLQSSYVDWELREDNISSKESSSYVIKLINDRRSQEK